MWCHSSRTRILGEKPQNMCEVYGIMAKHTCFMVTHSEVHNLLEVISHLIWKLYRVYSLWALPLTTTGLLTYDLWSREGFENVASINFHMRLFFSHPFWLVQPMVGYSFLTNQRVVLMWLTVFWPFDVLHLMGNLYTKATFLSFYFLAFFIIIYSKKCEHRLWCYDTPERKMRYEHTKMVSNEGVTNKNTE